MPQDDVLGEVRSSLVGPFQDGDLHAGSVVEMDTKARRRQVVTVKGVRETLPKEKAVLVAGPRHIRLLERCASTSRMHLKTRSGKALAESLPFRLEQMLATVL